MSNEWRAVLLIGGLCAAGLLVLSAAAQLAVQADRADTATNVAEVAAWQVSQVWRMCGGSPRSPRSGARPGRCSKDG